MTAFVHSIVFIYCILLLIFVLCLCVSLCHHVCLFLGPPVNKQKMYDHIHLQDIASQPTISQANDVSYEMYSSLFHSV